MPKYLCKCTQCGHELDMANNDGFFICPACGSKEYIKEPVTNNYINFNNESGLEYLLSSGEKLLKRRQWVQARDIYKRAINDYQYDYRGYYGHLIAVTENFTDLHLANYRDYYGYRSPDFSGYDYDYEMVYSLAPEEIKTKIYNQYKQWKQDIFEEQQRIRNEEFEEAERIRRIEEEIEDRYMKMPCRVYKWITGSSFCLAIIIFFIFASLRQQLSELAPIIAWSIVGFLFLGSCLAYNYRKFEEGWCIDRMDKARRAAGLHVDDPWGN